VILGRPLRAKEGRSQDAIELAATADSPSNRKCAVRTADHRGWLGGSPRTGSADGQKGMPQQAETAKVPDAGASHFSSSPRAPVKDGRQAARSINKQRRCRIGTAFACVATGRHSVANRKRERKTIRDGSISVIRRSLVQRLRDLFVIRACSQCSPQSVGAN
jgi:hypothetical protein